MRTLLNIQSIELAFKKYNSKIKSHTEFEYILKSFVNIGLETNLEYTMYHYLTKMSPKALKKYIVSNKWNKKDDKFWFMYSQSELLDAYYKAFTFYNMRIGFFESQNIPYIIYKYFI